MMHNNMMVCCLKANGKVLREHKTENETQVFLPFGSEYSILVKNLNSVRAMVKVSIDGNDVGGGHQFILQPNSELELERSVLNDNLSEGNRFKFIERTSAVEQHKGIGVEDGIVRVEFDFEKKEAVTIYPPLLPYRHYWNGWPYTIYGVSDSNASSGDLLRSYNANYSGGGRTTSMGVTSNSVSDTSFDGSLNIDGITVPGSISDQKFCYGSSFRTENNPRVIVLKLLGETERGMIKQPVTVKAKPKCVTCGRVNKATAKFCTECGTSLEIV